LYTLSGYGIKVLRQAAMALCTIKQSHRAVQLLQGAPHGAFPRVHRCELGVHQPVMSGHLF
jgi:hypothetical protein